MFEPKDQIVYTPTHANGDVFHEDSEFGFVTSVRGGTVFCRFWLKGSNPLELRTKANSEGCRAEDLKLFYFTHQAKVNALYEKLYAN